MPQPRRGEAPGGAFDLVGQTIDCPGLHPHHYLLALSLAGEPGWSSTMPRASKSNLRRRRVQIAADLGEGDRGGSARNSAAVGQPVARDEIEELSKA